MLVTVLRVSTKLYNRTHITFGVNTLLVNKSLYKVVRLSYKLIALAGVLSDRTCFIAPSIRAISPVYLFEGRMMSGEARDQNVANSRGEILSHTLGGYNNFTCNE